MYIKNDAKGMYLIVSNNNDNEEFNCSPFVSSLATLYINWLSVGIPVTLNQIKQDVSDKNINLYGILFDLSEFSQINSYKILNI